MKLKLFGYTIQKDKPQQFDDADRLVSFLIMAYHEKVINLLSPYQVKIHITEEEHQKYLHNGIVPRRIAFIASRYRYILIKHMHLFLKEEDDFNQVIGYSEKLPSSVLCEQIENLTKDWPVTYSGIPYQALHEYMPVHLTESDQKIQTEDIMRVRQLVWNFKYSNEKVTPQTHVYAMTRVADKLASLIINYFEKYTSQLTLFCLPASTKDTNYLRYYEFSQYLCKKTGLQNSFPHVLYDKDREPSHLGGERTMNYKLTTEYFSGKLIILFDDILTTGTSVAQTKELLEKAGARVVAAFFIAKTYKMQNE